MITPLFFYFIYFILEPRPGVIIYDNWHHDFLIVRIWSMLRSGVDKLTSKQTNVIFLFCELFSYTILSSTTTNVLFRLTNLFFLLPITPDLITPLFIYIIWFSITPYYPFDPSKISPRFADEGSFLPFTNFNRSFSTFRAPYIVVHQVSEKERL